MTWARILPAWAGTAVYSVLLGLASAVLVVGLWWLFLRVSLPTPPVNLSVPAAPAREVKAAPKIPVAVKSPVKVYAGGAQLKTKLRLPQAVVDDGAKQVIAASKLRADDHPQTVTTLINTETGDSETYVRRDPLPWLAWDTRGEVGVYLGVNNGGPALRVEARQGMVQAKALHLGVIGSVEQPLGDTAGGTRYFVGAGVWAKW